MVTDWLQKVKTCGGYSDLTLQIHWNYTTSMPKMTNLEALREARGMSRNALEGAVGVSRTAIVQLEDGETENPGHQLALDLARMLTVQHSDLLLPVESGASLRGVWA